MTTEVKGKADFISLGGISLTKNVSETFKQETKTHSFNGVPVSITDDEGWAIVSIHRVGYNENITVPSGTSWSGSQAGLPNLTTVFNRRDIGSGRKGKDAK